MKTERPRGNGGAPKLVASVFRDHLVPVLATGAVFSAFSEFWFYQLDQSVGQLALIGFYGVLGALFLLTLRMFQVRSFAGLFVAAGIFGFLVEGVLVPVVYLNLPFSLIWTSLAWHALFTISVGYYLYRLVMSAGTLRAAVLLNVVLGVGLGVWNAYLWNVVEPPDGGPIRYDWHGTGEFAAQFLVGWVLFMAGHVLLNLFPPSAHPPTRRAFAFFLTLPLALFFMGYFLPYFPFSLVLPLVLAVSFAALWAGRSNADNPWLARLFATRIPARRAWVTLLLPGFAIASYGAIATAGLTWETNVVVAGLAVPVSALLWIVSLVRAARRPQASDSEARNTTPKNTGN